MADLVITAANVDFVSGSKGGPLDAAEAVTAGDWLYEATASTVGVATNANAAKDTVIGMALNDAAANQPVVWAKDGSVVAMGSITTLGTWYVLSATGATSPVADQTSTDYVSLVGYGKTATQLQVKIVNTGLQLA